jgi:hypothetical protein
MERRIGALRAAQPGRRHNGLFWCCFASSAREPGINPA